MICAVPQAFLTVTKTVKIPGIPGVAYRVLATVTLWFGCPMCWTGCNTRLMAAELQVDADFPGGNIRVERVTGETVFLRQELRDTPRDWFYWACRVRGSQGRTVTFRFTGSRAFGPCGPAVSHDAGKTWAWHRKGVDGATFRCSFPANSQESRLAFCIPYTTENLSRFLERHRKNPNLRAGSLCQSSNGRNVELISVGRLDGNCRHRVLLTARHHACETMANYVLEGVIGSILADDDDGRWFREHVEFCIAPFMDKDGVEEGDQGKLRWPHDHWEDYAEGSRYREVVALKSFITKWSDGRLRAAIDIHCPARLDKRLYFAGPSRRDVAERLRQFEEVFRMLPGRSAPFYKDDSMPFNDGWNTAKYYGDRQCFMLWAEKLPGVQLAATMEVPYAQIDEVTMTPDLARRIGRDLSRALRITLAGPRQHPRRHDSYGKRYLPEARH